MWVSDYVTSFLYPCSYLIPALEVFKNADNREIFVNLVADKDGTAIKWLRIQIAKLP